MTRVVHRAEKHPANPVMTATEPWEMGMGSEHGEGNVYFGGTVLFDPDDDLYKMWYRTYDPNLEEKGHDSSYLNCYLDHADLHTVSFV